MPVSGSSKFFVRLFMLRLLLNKFKKKKSNDRNDLTSTNGNVSIEHTDSANSDKKTCCSIKVKDLKKNRNQPIFLNSRTGKFMSTQDGKITLQDGESMELFCTNQFKAPYNHLSVISLQCKDGKLKTTNIDCTDSGGMLHKSGFNTHLGFIELMTHCHDPNTKVNHWVDYYLTPENNICQGYIKDKFFPANYIEGKNIKELYANQRQTIAKILQSDELADKIISKKHQFVLDEGHLGPRSDFLLNSHQHATYNRINVMPQFKSFNGGNWNATERGLRDYIAKNKINARIRSGVYGTLEFNDITGSPKPISLSLDGRLPVPKIFYKIVIPEGQEPLIVFIGVNNPHATNEDIEREYTFCKNRITKKQLKDEFGIKMRWSDDFRLGYMYACRFDDFNQYVPQSHL